MGLDQRGEPAVDLLPHLVGHHRLQRRLGQLEGEVAGPAMAGVDDEALGRHGAVGACAHQESGDLLDRLLRGGEADPLQPVGAQRRQPLQREGEVRAALVRRERMDLVDDDAAGRRQHAPSGLGAQQDVERLRRGDQDMGRAAAHPVALAGRRVPGAHPGPDLHVRQPLGRKDVADAGQRRRQIALDVVGERLQRRDIDDLGLVAEAAVQPLAQHPVDGGKEGRQRLAGAGRGGDQRMAARPQRRPGLGLGGGGRREAPLEPGGQRGVEQRLEIHGGPIIARTPAAGADSDRPQEGIHAALRQAPRSVLSLSIHRRGH